MQQSGWFTDWFVFRQPLGALIFFIAATAEANRTPFDLTEADSEIVAGFATEYSGMRFGFLFFAEYVNVFIISALMVTLYFGAGTRRSTSRTSQLALDPGVAWATTWSSSCAIGAAGVHAGRSPRRSSSPTALGRRGRRCCSGSSRSTS